MQVRHLDRLGVRVDQLAQLGRFRWGQLPAGNRFDDGLRGLREVADGLDLRKVEGNGTVTTHWSDAVHAKAQGRNVTRHRQADGFLRQLFGFALQQFLDGESCLVTRSFRLASRIAGLAWLEAVSLLCACIFRLAHVSPLSITQPTNAKLADAKAASPLAGGRGKRHVEVASGAFTMADAKRAGAVLIGAAVVLPLLLHTMGLDWLGPYAFTLCLVGAVVLAADETIKRRLDQR